MIEVNPLGLWLFLILCSLQGQSFKIFTKFMNGNLIFTWSNILTTRNDITIIKDSQSSDWISVYDDQYTVKDVTLYKTVTIKVRELYTSQNYVKCNRKFNVITAESKEGESRNISWNAGYFPRSGRYLIFHVYNDSVSTIMMIGDSDPSSEKYIYHTRPLNSSNIQFEVKKLAVQDAGYYVGGATETDALESEGVVLIVFGKPVKAQITGNLNIQVGEFAYLKCESRSTSAPSYYKKFQPLTYSWFVSNTRLDREVRETYSFIVSKEVKYNKYSCQAKETLESERSEEIQINPLYGPGNVIINPQPPYDGLNIHDGETFGPYTCSSDCNPPCAMQWKYKHPLGSFRDATSILTSSVTVQEQTANRTSMASIRCIVSGTDGKTSSSIKLNIQYLLDPRLYINGKPSDALTINESNQVFLSCFVYGNPIPEITLRKLTGNQIYIQNVNHWLNYTLIRWAQCSDTGTFECVGQSTEFGRRNQSFSINVLCEPRLDEGTLVKNIYESRSGPDVKVVVSLPVVANPLTSTSGFVWLGPTFASISIDVSQRDNVVYKHWINSSIPVPDQRSFGTYSLKYKGKAFADITIHAKDVSAVSRESSIQTAWVVIGVLIGLFVLLLTSCGVYKFTFRR
ncbi:carcinoembryonic antigen-related cell adhesion molecule 5-like, partial [Saccostrea cucullata]|uniref:carcinoembryonic antigen-related cell adhesion molecule 5-like n=1 Tax=Saccostrea cuccullata TaxID=36930 RepID=UPI002ED00AB6